MARKTDGDGPRKGGPPGKGPRRGDGDRPRRAPEGDAPRFRKPREAASRGPDERRDERPRRFSRDDSAPRGPRRFGSGDGDRPRRDAGGDAPRFRRPRDGDEAGREDRPRRFSRDDSAPRGPRRFERSDSDRPRRGSDSDAPRFRRPRDGDESERPRRFARDDNAPRGPRRFERSGDDRPRPRREAGDRPPRFEGEGRPRRDDDRPPRRPRAERPAVEAEPDAPRPNSRPLKATPPKGPAETPPAADKTGERIAKVMARAGLGSRREMEQWVEAGRVAVNGEPLPERERTRLFLYNKPEGLVTTHSDPEGRPTLFEKLPPDLPRVISVGRLDIGTEGLLLLTNDGGLARTLELPATGWLRRYRVRAHGAITQDRLDALADGIEVDGVAYGPVEAKLDREQGNNVWLTLGLREGKNREVKNILSALGLTVNRLIRVSFGPFQLGELETGAVMEVSTRTLKDQLGTRLAEEAHADFSAPLERAEPPGRARKGLASSRDAEDKDDKVVRAGLVADRRGRRVLVERRSAEPAEAGETPAREERAPRRFREDGDRPRRPRDEGDRPPPRRFREDGDRPRRPREEGDRPPPRRFREDGDRPRRPRDEGDRPPPRRFREDGDRPRRPRDDGDRPPPRRFREDGDRPRRPRDEGDRPPPRRPRGDGPPRSRPGGPPRRGPRRDG
jgi:23S rRNA pseudouridine2605 synthase